MNEHNIKYEYYNLHIPLKSYYLPDNPENRYNLSLPICINELKITDVSKVVAAILYRNMSKSGIVNVSNKVLMESANVNIKMLRLAVKKLDGVFLTKISIGKYKINPEFRKKLKSILIPIFTLRLNRIAPNNIGHKFNLRKVLIISLIYETIGDVMRMATASPIVTTSRELDGCPFSTIWGESLVKGGSVRRVVNSLISSDLLYIKPVKFRRYHYDNDLCRTDNFFITVAVEDKIKCINNKYYIDNSIEHLSDEDKDFTSVGEFKSLVLHPQLAMDICNYFKYCNRNNLKVVN